MARTATGTHDERLVPADRLLAELAAVTLDRAQAVSISNGQAVTIPGSRTGSSLEGDLLRLYDGERFIGLGELNQGVIRPKRLMRTEH